MVRMAPAATKPAIQTERSLRSPLTRSHSWGLAVFGVLYLLFALRLDRLPPPSFDDLQKQWLGYQEFSAK